MFVHGLIHLVGFYGIQLVPAGFLEGVHWFDVYLLQSFQNTQGFLSPSGRNERAANSLRIARRMKSLRSSPLALHIFSISLRSPVSTDTYCGVSHVGSCSIMYASFI